MIHILRLYIILQSGDCKTKHLLTLNSAGRNVSNCKFSVLHILTISKQGAFLCSLNICTGISGLSLSVPVNRLYIHVLG